MSQAPRQPVTRSLSLAPDLAEVARGQQFLSQLALEAGFAEDRVFDITVACSRPIANAIEHSPVKAEVAVRSVLGPTGSRWRWKGRASFRPPTGSRSGATATRAAAHGQLSDHLALFGPGGRTFVSLTFYRPGVRAEGRSAAAVVRRSGPGERAPR